MNVFLTGGTGLLGSHVAETLRSTGMGVRALCRAGSDVRFLSGLGCRLVVGDLADPGLELSQVMGGCQGVVHAAADVYATDSPDAVYSINVEGTRRVFAAAEASGVSRGVHISTVAIYGAVEGPVTEEMAGAGGQDPKDHYGRTKRVAEEVVEGFQGRNGLEVTILRPSALFGERDRRVTPRFAKILRRRLVFLPGKGENRLALAYAGNVAAAVALALTGREGAGEAFNVTEDVVITPRSFFLGLGRELGVRPYFISLGGWMVRGGARLGEALGLGVPDAPGLSLTRAARLALEENPYSSEKARRMLGWQAPYPFEETMSRTGAWLRRQEGPNE